MPPNRELLDILEKADEADQVTYKRYLCEIVLEEHPDHGPTLIRYDRMTSKRYQSILLAMASLAFTLAVRA